MRVNPELASNKNFKVKNIMPFAVLDSGEQAVQLLLTQPEYFPNLYRQ
jgi:hypothetical protein